MNVKRFFFGSTLRISTCVCVVVGGGVWQQEWMEGKLDCRGTPAGSLKLDWPWEADMTLGEAAVPSLVNIVPWNF